MISTRTFWNELGILISHPLGGPEELDAELVKACEPLAAMSVIEEVLDRLWLATNHRMEWLMPALEVSGLQLDPNRIVCSSAVGSCKPDPTFYAHVASLVGTETILYFDDQEANLTIPRILGWSTQLVGEDPDQGLAALLGIPEQRP